jgi:Predicted signal transduction protein
MDPALTGLVLKTINSPLFGRGTKISSVHQAAALIGLRRLTNLVTAAAFNRLLDEYEGGARLILDFIQEQTQVAAAIATLTPELKPDEASLFALMQGVGCLIFADLVPDYGNEWALRALTAPQTLIEYERRILGTDHVTVGFLVAGTWHLPESVVLAIYHQYALEPPAQFEGSLRLLIAVARLARVVLARRRGIEDDPDLLDQRDWALAELAMPPAAWEQRISSLLADDRGH